MLQRCVRIYKDNGAVVARIRVSDLGKRNPVPITHNPDGTWRIEDQDFWNTLQEWSQSHEPVSCSVDLDSLEGDAWLDWASIRGIAADQSFEWTVSEGVRMFRCANFGVLRDSPDLNKLLLLHAHDPDAVAPLTTGDFDARLFQVKPLELTKLNLVAEAASSLTPSIVYLEAHAEGGLLEISPGVYVTCEELREALGASVECLVACICGDGADPIAHRFANLKIPVVVAWRNGTSTNAGRTFMKAFAVNALAAATRSPIRPGYRTLLGALWRSRRSVPLNPSHIVTGYKSLPNYLFRHHVPPPPANPFGVSSL